MPWARRLPSGRWQAQYRDPDGRVRSAGSFAHRAAAARAAGEAEAAARRAGWRDPDAGRTTVAAWVQVWLPTRTVAPGTAARSAHRLRRVLDRFGGVPLAEVTRHDVRAWAADLARSGLSAASVQLHVHLLSAALSAAVDAEVLPANPALRLRLPPPAPAVERYLTRGQAAALLDALADPYLLGVELLLGTGLRWGEMAGLHADRVDAGRGVLRVVEVWDEVGRTVRPYPKGRRARTVPLPAWLVDAVADRGGRGATCGAVHADGRACRSGLVVASRRTGGVVGYRATATAWRRATEAAGLAGVRVHDLRHTYASWQLQAGTSLAEVGRLLGHVSPATTARYAHLADADHAAVTAAVADPRVQRVQRVQQVVQQPGTPPRHTAPRPDGAETAPDLHRSAPRHTASGGA